MAKNTSGQLYTGYVINENAENGYNPVKVWIPSIHEPGKFFGEFKELGSNTGSVLGKNIAAGLTGVWCYRTEPVAPGGEAVYDSETDSSTTNTADLFRSDGSSIPDLIESVKNGITSPSSGKYNYSAVRSGIELIQDMFTKKIIDSKVPLTANNNQGQAIGTASTIMKGTKVLVSFADSGSQGFIVSQISGTDSSANGGMISS